MGYVNDVINRPISIKNIHDALNSTAYSLSVLSKDTNKINLWAKYKPYNNEYDYGIVKKTISTWSDLISNCNGTKNGWVLSPKQSEFKISDFENYKSDSKCIFSGVTSIDVEYAKTDKFIINLNTNIISSKELSISDIGVGSSKFSLYLKNGNNTTTKSASGTLISDVKSVEAVLSDLVIGEWDVYPYLTGNYTLPFASSLNFSLITKWVSASSAYAEYDDTNLTFSITISSNATKLAKTFSNVTFSVLDSTETSVCSDNKGTVTLDVGGTKALSGNIAVTGLDPTLTFYYKVSDADNKITEIGNLDIVDMRFYYVAKISHNVYNDAPYTGGEGSHTYNVSIYKHWKKDDSETLYEQNVDTITFYYTFDSANTSHTDYNTKTVSKSYKNNVYGIDTILYGTVDQKLLPYNYAISYLESSRSNAPYTGGDASVTYSVTIYCTDHPTTTSEQVTGTKTYTHTFSATESTTGNTYTEDVAYSKIGYGDFIISDVTYTQNGKPDSGETSGSGSDGDSNTGGETIGNIVLTRRGNGKSILWDVTQNGSDYTGKITVYYTRENGTSLSKTDSTPVLLDINYGESVTITDVKINGVSVDFEEK